jgi:hypothetical protein
MDENQQPKRQIYYIPDNFIAEQKIRVGQLSLDIKYGFDMLIFGGIGFLIGLLIKTYLLPNLAKAQTISLYMMCMAPGLLIGYMGFNGDPISQAIKSFFSWKQNNSIKIFNPNPRLLGTDAVKAMADVETTRDKLVDKLNEFKEKQIEKRKESDLVEGENFTFAYDQAVDDYLDDNGDYSNFQNSDGSFDINISGGGLDDNNFFYSRDGYNDDDDDEKEYYQSDFEHV